MTSRGRGLLTRIGVLSSNWRYRDLPEPMDQFNVRMEYDDDADSIRSVLPPYSPRADEPFYRPPSPAPSYSTLDIRETSPARNVAPRRSGPPHNALPKPQAAIDDLVNRLTESLRNPQAWRVKHDGKLSFFWALRCEAGMARVLNNYIEEIKTRALGTNDWKVERFCFIFKGQQLAMLWCRPIHTEVFIYCYSTTDLQRHGTHADRLKDDYIVVHLYQHT
jgi:hypothetical protein